MKKTIALTFVLTILLCLFGTLDSFAATSGYYTYTVSNGEATITDCSTSISGNVTIPSTLGGYPVTSIGDDAFSDCESLTSITIPDSVTSIGDFAFLFCTSLTRITIPDGVTSIGVGAFWFCTSLTSITIGNSATSISDDAFYECTNLTNISVDKYNPYYSSDANGILYNKNKTELICCPAGTNLTSITIPNSVTSIGYRAFYDCESLTSITIPDSVTSIGNSAFYDCESLTSITIPDGVTSIGNYAFYGCTSLTSITIPDGVTSIGDDAFSCCESLTSITIPDSVTSIGDRAFYDCYRLTSITIPDSVTSIGYSAFNDCTNLTSITIPNSVTSIGGRAFEHCLNLKTVYYCGSPNNFNKISIGSGNSYFKNAEVIHILCKIKIFDMLGNVLCEKTQFRGDPIDLSDVIDNNAQYYLYHDNEKISKCDITSPVTSDLALYIDVFAPSLETITITGRNSADVGETITETVYFATNKDIKYISFDVRFPEHLKHKIIPVDFMYVEEASSKTENGFTTLTLTCVYSNSGYAPKNKTIIPFELEFEIDKYAKVGENSIEILDSTKYGDKTLESFTNLNSTYIEINPTLAENIVISGADTISDITEYTAIVTPDYTTNKGIEWFVSDSTTATITQDGVLKPIKNGQVKIYVQTIDGSNLIAEKVVNVSAKAKIESLTTSVGDWEYDFNNDIREYVVYVPENCENISVSATYNGEGILKIGGRISITGTLLVQLENTTTTILVERVDAGADYIDGTYTLTVVKTKPFAAQKEIQDNNIVITATIPSLYLDYVLYVACYDENNKLLTLVPDEDYINGEEITVANDSDISYIKVFLWESASNIKPLENAVILDM